jgi:hypothetical protein
MDVYASGGGAHDLVDRLGMQSCESLALTRLAFIFNEESFSDVFRFSSKVARAISV